MMYPRSVAKHQTEVSAPRIIVILGDSADGEALIETLPKGKAAVRVAESVDHALAEVATDRADVVVIGVDGWSLTARPINAAPPQGAAPRRGADLLGTAAVVGSGAAIAGAGGFVPFAGPLIGATALAVANRKLAKRRAGRA